MAHGKSHRRFLLNGNKRAAFFRDAHEKEDL